MAGDLFNRCNTKMFGGRRGGWLERLLAEEELVPVRLLLPDSAPAASTSRNRPTSSQDEGDSDDERERDDEEELVVRRRSAEQREETGAQSTSTDGQEEADEEAAPAEEDESRRVAKKREVPLWLARALEAEGCCAIGLPRALGTGMLSTLKADANSVSLRRCPHFYKLGLLLAATTGDQELTEQLLSIFIARFLHVLDQAVNWRHQDSDMLQGLCIAERKLYLNAHHAAAQLDRWKNRKEEKLEPTHRKRKRLGVLH